MAFGSRKCPKKQTTFEKNIIHLLSLFCSLDYKLKIKFLTIKWKTTKCWKRSAKDRLEEFTKRDTDTWEQWWLSNSFQRQVSVFQIINFLIRVYVIKINELSWNKLTYRLDELSSNCKVCVRNLKFRKVCDIPTLFIYLEHLKPTKKYKSPIHSLAFQILLKHFLWIACCSDWICGQWPLQVTWRWQNSKWRQDEDSGLPIAISSILPPFRQNSAQGH